MKTNDELIAEKESLKEKHKKVFELRVATNDEETEFCTIFLKPFDEVVYKAVSKVIENDELNAARILINSLWIGGDDKTVITSDFDNILSASKQLGKMFKARTAAIEVLVKKK